MADSPLDTPGIVELVTGMFLLNIGVIAVASGIVSGAAVLLGRTDLAGIFATTTITVVRGAGSSPSTRPTSGGAADG